MKKHSRFTAFLVTVMLVLSMLPSAVFASEFVMLDGELKIKGDAVTESVLSPDYEKVIPEGITDDQVKFLWMRTTLEEEEKAELEETENLTRQEIGKEKTYTVTAEDIGFIIVLQITGLEEMGYTGSLTAKTEVITEDLFEDEPIEELIEEPIEELVEEPIENESQEMELIQENEFEEELYEEETYEEETLEDEILDQENDGEEILDEDFWNEELFDVVIDEEIEIVNDSGNDELNTNDADGEKVFDEIIVEEEKFDENGIPVEETPTEETPAGETSSEETSTDENEEVDLPSAFSADVTNVDFGTVIDGYTSEEIEAKIVHVTNNSEVNLPIKVTAENFIVTRVLAEGEDETVILAGATATYKILPKEGLWGMHVDEEMGGGLQLSEDIVFAEDIDDIENPNLVRVSADIDVEPAEPTEAPAEPTATPEPTKVSIAVDTSSYDFGTKEEGYESAPEALKVTIKNTGDTSITLLQPTSDFFKIGELSATVLQPGEKAMFAIRPKKQLEKGQYHETIVVETKEGVSDFIDVQFAVSEKKTREPQVATADQNKITGISSDSYTTQSKITFTAVGGGMDNTDPVKGDVRYCPQSWSVFNVNSWKNSDYSASFGMGKAGTYNLTVTFVQQQFDGNSWVDTGKQDTKTVSFKVVDADDSVKLTPAAEKDTNQKDAVKTGDTTVILPLIIALLVALGCVIGVLVYRKKR